MGLGNIGIGELAVIFLIVLLLFGAKRLPEIGKSLGSGIREFKKAAREVSREASIDPDDEAARQKNATRTPPPIE